MARVTKKVCDRCGREIGPASCREVPLGFFCLRDSLILSDEAIIRPTVEITPAEQKVIDAFAVPVAAAAKLTEEAEAAYAEADRRHFDAAWAETRAGVADERTPTILHESRGGLGRDDSDVQIDAARGFVRLVADPVKNARIRRENVAAREALADAEAALRKARSKLSKLEHAQNRALQIARDGNDWAPLAPDTGQ